MTADESLYRQSVIKRAKKSFKFFFNTVFIKSIEEVDGEIFQGGEWVDRFCDRLQHKKKTCTTAPRKHAKTTIILGFLAWLIFRCDVNASQYSEYLYMMYSDDLACEKITLLKQYIKTNDYFAGLVDLKPTADTVIFYQNNGHYISVRPAGIYSFKRGKHPHGVICDDILKDAEKKLDLTQITKITQIFEAQVTPLTKEGGFIHVLGTRQDATDLFSKLAVLPGWDCEFNKAIIDRKKKTVLWPEKFTYERLIDIELNETGKKNFLREYQDEPVRGVEGYFTRDEVEQITDKELKNYGVAEKESDKSVDFGETYAGLDIGKKRHPAHLVVFQVMRVFETVKDKDGKDTATEIEVEKIYLIQLCSLWMDRMDYNDQVDICEQAIRKFGIVKLKYDNTRGEYEGFAERGELPGEMDPVSMNDNDRVAADLDKLVGKKEIILLDDTRQTNQILAVDNSLQAPSTEEGHGDSFWSIGLMAKGFLEDNGGSGFV